MLEGLKREVCAANKKLVAERLVVDTWGNVSGIDRASGRVVIKPSGVPYETMKPSDMVVVDLANGKVVEGKLAPSSDTATHLILYRAFSEIGGVAHTHSLYATAWAQTCHPLPAFGTTHADYFYGSVPCTRLLTPREIRNDYEENTGHIIVETFRDRDPLSCPAILVANHGPFAWGRSVPDSVRNISLLDHIARLATETLHLDRAAQPLQQALLDKHFFRKHGPNSYYGQTAKNKSRDKR
jgi:L-ribulose-5-phosphate 4-epimerase